MWESMQEGKSYKGNLKLNQVTTVLSGDNYVYVIRLAEIYVD